MGALARVMPITGVTFLIGWLSIGGVPLFSGFWSKGDVLLNAYRVQPGAVGGRCPDGRAHGLLHGSRLPARVPGEQRWVEAKPRKAGQPRSHGGTATPARPLLGDVAAARRARRPVGLRGAHQLALPSRLRLPRAVAEPGVRHTPVHAPAGASGALWAFALVDAALALARRRARHRAVGPDLRATRCRADVPPPRLVHRLGLRPLHRPPVDRGRRRDILGRRDQGHRRRRERFRRARAGDGSPASARCRPATSATTPSGSRQASCSFSPTC